MEVKFTCAYLGALVFYIMRIFIFLFLTVAPLSILLSQETNTENKKTDFFLEEIKEIFGNNVEKKGSFIVAKKLLSLTSELEDLKQQAKKLGFNFSGVDAPKNENDVYSLRYAEFVVPLVKAVQEQQQMITDMQKRIQLLEDQNKLLLQLVKK